MLENATQKCCKFSCKWKWNRIQKDGASKRVCTAAYATNKIYIKKQSKGTTCKVEPLKQVTYAGATRKIVTHQSARNADKQKNNIANVDEKNTQLN